MTTSLRILTTAAVLLASQAAAPAGGKQSAGPLPFPTARVHFEQNATDGDVEVVFEVKGGDEGLTQLTVTSPDGRTVIDFTAPDASTLGIRQFHFESPEPGDVEGLKAAYPQGVYTFTGATAAGQKLRGKSTLTHKLPPTISFVRPAAGQRNVRVENLQIRWSTVRNVTGYIVEIEHDELDVNVTARLPASASTFTVPAGFLLPGREYELGIGTVSGDGNVSFVETTFTTARSE